MSDKLEDMIKEILNEREKRIAEAYNVPEIDELQKHIMESAKEFTKDEIAILHKYCASSVATQELSQKILDAVVKSNDAKACLAFSDIWCADLTQHRTVIARSGNSHDLEEFDLNFGKSMKSQETHKALVAQRKTRVASLANTQGKTTQNNLK